VELRVEQRVKSARWIFLPIGLCALCAVGAHAAADVLAGRTLLVVDRIDAFFDGIFARWSFTAPMVDWIGLSQRTFFARAVALVWELASDAILAIPLLDYRERTAADEWALARATLTKRRPSLRLLPPLATLLVTLSGARAIQRLVRASLLHVSWLGQLLGLLALLALAGLFVPRAVFRSLEHASARKAALGLLALIVLLPLALAALGSL